MNSLSVNKVTFKEIERSFFEIGCEVAKMLMAEFLVRLDKELCKNRNKAELRH
ncbi:MAG TPA: ISLre2 family transposase, partial [Clostridiaceae bacterium]|nr:ISLre2 family transposase [Clostridiaceae bacterium]